MIQTKLQAVIPDMKYGDQVAKKNGIQILHVNCLDCIILYKTIGWIDRGDQYWMVCAGFF